MIYAVIAKSLPSFGAFYLFIRHPRLLIEFQAVITETSRPHQQRAVVPVLTTPRLFPTHQIHFVIPMLVPVCLLHRIRSLVISNSTPTPILPATIVIPRN